MKDHLVLALTIVSAQAVPILTEVQSFTQSQNASTVAGAVALPAPERFPGVSDSFLLFGSAQGGLELPLNLTLNSGPLQRDGFLAVINQVEVDEGSFQWMAGTSPNQPTQSKAALIQGIGRQPGNPDENNTRVSVVDASFGKGETFWITGVVEEPDVNEPVRAVQVNGIGLGGVEALEFTWDRFGKSGYLMKWDLASFRPTQTVPLLDPTSDRIFSPVALTALEDESVLVLATDEQSTYSLRKHDATGKFSWSWRLPDDGAKGVQLIEGKGENTGLFFILAEVPGQAAGSFGGQDVVLYCVTPNANNSGVEVIDPWHNTRLGGSSDDFAADLVAQDNGTLSMALTLTTDEAIFPTLPNEDYGDLDQEHCLVANLALDEIDGRIATNWVQVVGKALDPPLGGDGKMRAARLDVDPVGNLHLGLTGAGVYEIECVPRTLTGGGGLVSIDGTGRVWDFKPLPDFTAVTGVLGRGIDRQIAVGNNEERLTMSVFREDPRQESYLVSFAVPTVDGEAAIKELTREVTALGGQVHLEMRHERFDIYQVAAFFTPEQLQAFLANPRFRVQPDPPVITQNSGAGETQSDAGWALRRINVHGDATAGATSSYEFWLDDAVQPEERPWVFLLDTGLPIDQVDDLSGSRFAPRVPYDPAFPVEMGWGEKALEAPIGAETEEGEYMVNLDSDHAQKVTRLMAFQPYGSGQGIPFNLQNINIFPDRGSGEIVTYPSYVADGIFLAIDQVLDEREIPTSPQTGALIVIPSSGQTTVALNEFFTLSLAIDEALDANIAIVLSAGNAPGAAVEMNVPAGYGKRDGIITVGATNIATGGVLNARALAQTIDASGLNETISLHAPGVAVPVGAGGETFDGTSASCAFAAGVAAAILSRNPDVAPEVLENAMIANSVFQASNGINLLTLDLTIPEGCGFQDWLKLHDLAGGTPWGDSDGDDFIHLKEYLGGSDPNDDSSTAGPVLLTSDDTENWNFEIELPTWALSGSGMLDLGCGTTIAVTLESSTDLEAWIPEIGPGWQTGPADIARRMTPLVFTVPKSSIGEKRFWRLALRPSP